MPDDMMSQAAAQLFAAYGPPGLVLFGALWLIKYLLDDRKELISAHKTEIAAERSSNAQLQKELLAEARANGDLAVSVKDALEALAKPAKEAR